MIQVKGKVPVRGGLSVGELGGLCCPGWGGGCLSILSRVRWWVGSSLHLPTRPPEPSQGTRAARTPGAGARGRTRHQGNRDRRPGRGPRDPPGAGGLIYILPASDFHKKSQVRMGFTPRFRLTQGIPETPTPVSWTGEGIPSTPR